MEGEIFIEVPFTTFQKKTADKKEQPVEAEKLIPDSGNIQEPHDEEEEDPRTHFRKNLAKSLIMMAIGTALVAFFSDPMGNFNLIFDICSERYFWFCRQTSHQTFLCFFPHHSLLFQC